MPYNIYFTTLGKKDAPVPKKRVGTVSKEFRRSETRKKLQEISKQLSTATVSNDFVVVDTRKKLYHLKGTRMQRSGDILTLLQEINALLFFEWIP